MQNRLLVFILMTAVAGPAYASGEECGDLSYEGECHGDTARWCEYGRVYEVDCGDRGLTCGWDGQGGYFGCVGEGDEVECEDGLDWEGTCEGNQLFWCEGGETESLTCKDGTECAWNAASGYYDCIPKGQSGQGFAPDAGFASEGDDPGAEPGSPSEEGGDGGDFEDDWGDDWDMDNMKQEEGGSAPIDSPPAAPGSKSSPTEPKSSSDANPGASSGQGCATSGAQATPPWVVALALAVAGGLRRRRSR